MHQTRLIVLWASIEQHSIFKTLAKQLGEGINIQLKEYIDKNEDRYNYINAERAFNHWNPQIQKRFNSGRVTNYWVKPFDKKAISGESQLKDYFDKIEEYKTLSKKYEYKSLPTNDQVKTPQKLADQYGLTLDKVFVLLADPDMKDQLEIISNEMAIKNKEILYKLTEKYNIPLVITK